MLLWAFLRLVFPVFAFALALALAFIFVFAFAFAFAFAFVRSLSLDVSFEPRRGTDNRHSRIAEKEFILMENAA